MCLAVSCTIVESVSQRLLPREGAGGGKFGGWGYGEGETQLAVVYIDIIKRLMHVPLYICLHPLSLQ